MINVILVMQCIALQFPLSTMRVFFLFSPGHMPPLSKSESGYVKVHTQCAILVAL